MVQIRFKIGTEHTDTVKHIYSREVRHCCNVQVSKYHRMYLRLNKIVKAKFVC
jgi:hypothetical protein